jgi:4-alpha-glucanotransferase
MSSLGRLSGILLPLFSLRSKDDFGIGDFGAIDGLLDWMQSARQRLIMFLPLLPTAPGDPSPYATRSAFGLNPLFIDLHALPEFVDAGGYASLSDQERSQLDEARAAPRIRYDLVFPLKRAVLRRAFDRFERDQWVGDTVRAEELRDWADAERGWLETWAQFAAISDDQQNRPWWEWPDGLDRHDTIATSQARARLSREILFRTWQQWVAHTQWKKVREAAAKRNVLLAGDEPFIIGQDSADVWANPELLRRDARLGVPPDDFSATGQDWGLPYFDFEAMQKDDYAWLRFRARKAASYYDVRRVDHAVGYFRQWIRDDQTPNGRFVPGAEEQQRRLGELHFRLLSEEAPVIAEDLGVIPPWVRETLTRLGLPGYKVMRWERDGTTYRNPHEYPMISLATTGTHDTDTLAEWWESATAAEREGVAQAWPEFRGVELSAQMTPRIHEALLAASENSGSELAVLPWQDILGTRDRINLPGSMSEANWAYRISWNTSELLSRPETRKAAALMARLAEQGRR